VSARAGAEIASTQERVSCQFPLASVAGQSPGSRVARRRDCRPTPAGARTQLTFVRLFRGCAGTVAVPGSVRIAGSKAVLSGAPCLTRRYRPTDPQGAPPPTVVRQLKQPGGVGRVGQLNTRRGPAPPAAARRQFDAFDPPAPRRGTAAQRDPTGGDPILAGNSLLLRPSTDTAVTTSCGMPIAHPSTQV
jgi:hypothetical protein